MLIFSMRSNSSDPAEDPEGLASAIAEAFRRIQFLRQRLLGRRMAAHGLPPSQGACLRVIGERGDLSQRELAQALDLTPAALTGLLQRMEAAGLVERWSDGRDQRVMRVRLGQAGQALKSQADETHRWIQERTLETLPEGDRRELLRLLQAVGANFEAAGADAR